MKALKWQLQEAKNKFSEVIRKAIQEGPQTVTRHGKDSVVILSINDYDKLTKPESNLIDFFQDSPLASVNLELKRDNSAAREILL